MTASELRRVRDEFGPEVCIVSGRNPAATEMVRAAVGPVAGLIALNGALVLKGWGGAVISEETFPVAVAREIFQLARVLELHFGAFANDEWVVASEDHWTDREARGCGFRPTALIPSAEHLTRYFQKSIGLHKVMVRGQASSLDRFVSAMSGDLRATIHVMRSSPTMIECGSNAARKERGLGVILGRLGIDWKDVLAVGDGVSDVELLRRAGASAAMENAAQVVKDAAGEITLSNNLDGVGLLMRKYFASQNSMSGSH